MVLERIEELWEGGVEIGRQVFDKDGNSLKVKVGKGGHLREKWDELQPGKAYKFAMGEFKGYPYVEDFELVKDVFVAEAAKKLDTQQGDAKNHAFALSYAKDIAVAQISKGETVNLGKLIIVAEVMFQYLEGNLTPDVEKTIAAIMAKSKKGDTTE